MGDPVGLFLCRGYGYGVVIPGGYLPIAISSTTTPISKVLNVVFNWYCICDISKIGIFEISFPLRNSIGI
jgi:hypothetical protein